MYRKFETRRRNIILYSGCCESGVVGSAGRQQEEAACSTNTKWLGTPNLELRT